MITDKQKLDLREFYGYDVESESPLVLKGTDNDERLVGTIAEIVLKEFFEDFEEDNQEVLDLENLATMDDNDILLVSGNFNYADEFDLAEWTTMTVGEFKEIVEHLKGIEDEFEIGFGTNEELRFDDGEDLLSQLSFEKITQEQSDVLDKLFGGSFDGGSGVFDRIWEMSSEYDENEDDNLFDKEDLRNIEYLKGFGWEVAIHDEKEYLLSFKSPEGEVSIAPWGMIHDLKDYCRKIKN